MTLKKMIGLIFLCFCVIMVKYVLSGAYFDYNLRNQYLQNLQDKYIDENKRSIADLELYRSANYLFTYKEQLGMKELTLEKTIILQEAPKDVSGNNSEIQVSEVVPKQ